MENRWGSWSCLASLVPLLVLLCSGWSERSWELGPRGARAQGGTQGSAGMGAPMECCSDPHNLAQGGRKGVGRKGEHHGSCPARTLVVVHTHHELWPRKMGSSLPPSPSLVRLLPLFTCTSALVYQRALYSTGHDFITNNTTLLFKWVFQMFFIVC